VRVRRRAAASSAGLGLVLLLTVSSFAAAAPTRVAGQVVVRFRSDATADARKAARERASATVVRTLDPSGLELLSTGGSVDAAVARLQRDRAVRAASPNFVYRGAAVPNDPLFPEQWALDDIDAPEAWDLSTGERSAPVAVVDSGVAYRDPEFANNIWTNSGETAGNGVDDDGNGFVDDRNGYDFVGDDGDPDDPEGHGTHVAGIIAARTNNRMGVAGINPRAALIAVRVLDADDIGTTATVAAGLEYAVRAGARVVSASVARAGADPVLDSVVEDHPRPLFVFPAGNSGSDDDQAPVWPCGIDDGNVICVAATDQHDALASFSNFGARSVDLAAPGEAILSTWPGGE
jgi:serine protease